MAERKSNRMHVLKLIGTVCAMFVFGFALVPLYDVLCDVTGLNGRSSDAFAASSERATGSAVDTSRTVTVEIVTTVNASAPWAFDAVTERIELHPGEFVTARVLAENLEQQAKTVQAVPSVLPYKAARYVHKTACFCFDQQSFGAGQSREMPVVFTVDPELPAEVDTVTMSYTLFELTDTAAAKAR
ncbi:cytochrome c oxidase assembly protein [Algiphilus sp.]|uniref:cytochrome c oxidase assembly protein n=1 Tax=Algiphilus sp. TaxID=1872431 RepID=UPI0025BCEF07|nr:cytochrome c oxidase assembly protein [Algiphilus sp.]MCK5771252.1 cytochrome c oxidase assembly protein [Algiphilus sp.]